MNKFREYKIIYECISLPMNAIETETETERDGKRQKKLSTSSENRIPQSQ